MITVFCDLDGVLTDFDGKCIELMGKRLRDFATSAEGWAETEKHQHLYRWLDPMPDARHLVDGIHALYRSYNFHVEILTAIPKIGRMPHARIDKRLWIDQHFPQFRHVINFGPHAVHKQFHCSVGDVLIDDSEMNCDQWRERQGHSIMHVSAKDTLEKLDHYLRNP